MKIGDTIEVEGQTLICYAEDTEGNCKGCIAEPIEIANLKLCERIAEKTDHICNWIWKEKV